MLSDKQKEQIRELRTLKRPMSYLDISFEMAISEDTIRKFCQKEGLNKRSKSTKKPFSYGVYKKRHEVHN